jgi:hypothetical protein
VTERLRYAVVVVVVVVWVINFAAGLLLEGYEPRESINGIFMAVVGGALALGGKKDRADD